jgi:hypothetical protein
MYESIEQINGINENEIQKYMNQHCDKVQIRLFYLKLRSKGLSVNEASKLADD